MHSYFRETGKRGAGDGKNVLDGTCQGPSSTRASDYARIAADANRDKPE